jgi:alginate O-acetyltransferase complex protein AlgI
MLFNSHEFLLGFLPLVFLLFWYGGRSLRWRLGLLTAASYVFYSWWQFDSWADVLSTFRIGSRGDLADSIWKWRFTVVMLLSSTVDYWAARWIVRTPVEQSDRRKLLLGLSLAANLGLLGFFKYAGFFEKIASDLIEFAGGGALPVVSMALPVGISFYTFESMSYVIDIYRGVASPAKSYLDYACFISFFPHLVAGPIIRYSDILHQFRDINWVRKGPDWEQIDRGLLFLSIGMVKKLLVADQLALAIGPLWNSLSLGQGLGFAGSWAAVLGYTFRIYFDFSGYSDMATGLGHLLAVRLPQNFDSPYKATDPSDFWRRWHITLSTWLRDYLYIPLGGSRNGRQARNLMITMMLGGLWHGAAWLFVIWGIWHGFLLVAFHQLKRWRLVPSNDRLLSYWFNRQVTFLLIVIGWVFFRAADVRVGEFGFSSILPAVQMLAQMIGLHGIEPTEFGLHVPRTLWGLIAGCWLWCNFAPNSFEVVYAIRTRAWQAALAGAILGICVLRFGAGVDFLYFRF